ncbi:hypothetical protein [Dactylosporangium sp. NPDC000521]|uniref:hypothetical protein n=1 Tax=Dactylosporangium sp. NPDC000521 TaxID=3363975 RepID=UPI0036947219
MDVTLSAAVGRGIGGIAGAPPADTASRRAAGHLAQCHLAASYDDGKRVHIAAAPEDGPAR